MLKAITMNRIHGNGRYAPILDVLERLAEESFSNGTSEAAKLMTESPRYRETLARLQSEGESQPKTKRNRKP